MGCNKASATDLNPVAVSMFPDIVGSHVSGMTERLQAMDTSDVEVSKTLRSVGIHEAIEECTHTFVLATEICNHVSNGKGI